MKNKICAKCKKQKAITDFPRERRLKNGYSSRCKECTNSENRIRWNKNFSKKYKNNAEYREKRKAYMRKWSTEHRKKLNKIVYEHYGNKCACCKEKRQEFFAIDHINGGGRKHRKEIESVISRWIIKNNFPKEFRILCHNCNMSLGIHGYCPHNKKFR